MRICNSYRPALAMGENTVMSESRKYKYELYEENTHYSSDYAKFSVRTEVFCRRGSDGQEGSTEMFIAGGVKVPTKKMVETNVAFSQSG